MPNELNDLYEKIGKIDMKADASHSRLDEFAKAFREDVTEIKNDVKNLVAAENRRTGWTAAMMLVGTVISGLIGYFLKG